jgi:Cellulase (glycosyl hydrolase family 5)
MVSSCARWEKAHTRPLAGHGESLDEPCSFFSTDTRVPTPMPALALLMRPWLPASSLCLALLLVACGAADAGGASPQSPPPLPLNAATLPLAALAPAGAHPLPAARTIAAFDAPPSDALSQWSYSPGSEFPGASGSLVDAEGRTGRGAALRYDFSCGGTHWVALAGRSCGRYVAMQLNKMPAALTHAAGDEPAIAFDVFNARATAWPTLRVIDHTGQTLQFKANARPLENHLGQQWTRVLVPVGASALHWGGANDGVLHLPIRRVVAMADGVLLPSPPGEMLFDNFTYLSSAETAYTLVPDAALTALRYPASYVGRVGVVWRPRFGYAALDKALAVGLNVVRFDLTWQSVESQGKFDFSHYSAIADELARRNVRVLWVLAYGHTDHGGARPLSASDQAAFAEFARRAALTFKGRNVAGFEIWNEPNWAPFWPQPDAAAYGRLLATSVAAIRAVDPAVPIVTGGLADGDLAYLMKLLRTGAAKGVNAVGVHPYRLTGPETFAAQLPTLHQMLAAVQLDAAVWDTEWGYSSYRDVGDLAQVGDGHDPRARRRQAILNLRKVLTGIAVNMPLSVLYELVDEGRNPLDREHNFGLLQADLSDKPGMVAMRALHAVQRGRTLKGLVRDVPPGLHVLRWDGAADQAFIIWSDAPAGVRTRLTLPAATRSVTAWDGATPEGANTTRTLTLQESDGPLVVILGR